MTNVNSSMCLKMKKGTFFMPEANGSVYFRNNSGSFRMEGTTVHQWVEKLIPMLNGEHTLSNLTDGLPEAYRDRIYEMADTLYQNGFLQDISTDRPHELKDHIVEKFASQIEFLESFGDSAAYRFQQYRQQKILAIGEGSMFTGLVSALLQSGLSVFHALLTDADKTTLQRVSELEKHARETDPDVSIEVVVKKEQTSWEDDIAAFDSVLYISELGNTEELRSILLACKKQKKIFAPAFLQGNYGFAGPIVSPDTYTSWESAWRNIPESASEEETTPSPTGCAMLVNVLVFEMFKMMTDVKESHHTDHMFLLNMETLEGRWHPFKPHPLITGTIEAEKEAIVLDGVDNPQEREALFYFFSEMTESKLGIFRRWDEGDLIQLPLSQCEIQVADVTSSGPSASKPGMIISRITHEEARKDAGLFGIEHYLHPLKTEILASAPLESQSFQPFHLHLGAGASRQEAISRALQKTIETTPSPMDNVTKIKVDKIADEECRFYWQALKTMKATPELALGANAFGFPVVCTKTSAGWREFTGFNRTLAFRAALRTTVMQAQNQSFSTCHPCSPLSFQEKEVHSIDIPACGSEQQLEVLPSVMERLQQKNHPLSLLRVKLDGFPEDGVLNIYGVLFKEGASM